MPRGVHYKFSPGDYALCFEPDDKKAKVLYIAKVVDVSVKRANGGQRVPAYHIHFQGWNNNWDRWVPEHMLLEDTDFNRALMHRCQQLVRHGRNRHDARERVANLLAKVKSISDPHSQIDWAVLSSQDGSSASEFDSGSAEEDMRTLLSDDEICKMAMVEKQTSLITSNLIVESVKEASSSEEENDNDSNNDDHTVHSSFVPDLPPPPGVRAYLEADWRRVKSFSANVCNIGNEKVLHLPAQPSVCAILEQYLAEFPRCHAHHVPLKVREQSPSPTSTVCASLVLADASSTHPAVGAAAAAAAGGGATASDDKDAVGLQYAEADVDMCLCHETISSLRVLFDFVAEPRLLIDEELACFHEMASRPADPAWLSAVSVTSKTKQSICPSTINQLQVEKNEHHNVPYPLLPRDPSSPGLGPPAPPSAFLGLQHLLRMLVSLPELLEYLEKLEAASRTIILRHTRLLLLYLDEHLKRFTSKGLQWRKRTEPTISSLDVSATARRDKVGQSTALLNKRKKKT